jgi:hypothetical protein
VKDFQRRLERAAAAVQQARRQAPPREDDASLWWGRARTALLAAHVGKLSSEESIVEAHARALAYGTCKEFSTALKADRAEIDRRTAMAMERLQGMLGVDLATANAGEFATALTKMEDAIPFPLQSRLIEFVVNRGLSPYPEEPAVGGAVLTR